MSVDKFGHFTISNLKPYKGDVPKVLGLFLDNNRNLDLQNKKIENLATPTEEADAVNKIYLQTQINIAQELLKNYFNNKIDSVEHSLTLLNRKLIDFYELLTSIPIYNAEENTSK